MIQTPIPLKRLLQEPMLHFFLIGVVLFAAYGLKAPAKSEGRRIVITQGVIDDLRVQHVAARGREPSPTELNNLIEAYVRDEILYREGRALGLERDDIVVKRRVRQKIEVMQEEQAASQIPSDAELSAYLEQHRSRFVEPSLITFDQAFFGSSLSEPRYAVALIRSAAQRGEQSDDVGQPTLLPHHMARTPSDIIARTFGEAFATSLETAPLNEWTGPIHSSFGIHYVRVTAYTPAAMPQLPDVRNQVMREWENERRVRARDDMYARLRAGYDVAVEARLQTP